MTTLAWGGPDATLVAGLAGFGLAAVGVLWARLRRGR